VEGIDEVKIDGFVGNREGRRGVSLIIVVDKFIFLLVASVVCRVVLHDRVLLLVVLVGDHLASKVEGILPMWTPWIARVMRHLGNK
jgi:hypothetical protein